MDKLTAMEQRQIIRDYQQDNEIESAKAERIRIWDKLSQLEGNKEWQNLK
jgi:hypothetical protein